MVRDGIVLGHKVSEQGIKVDRAKVEIMPVSIGVSSKTFQKLQNP